MEKLASENIEKIYDLSPMQEGILFHYLREKDSRAYFEQYSFNLDGKVDIQMFEQSFCMLIQRHEILRSIIIHEKLKKPQQVILKSRKTGIYFEDISMMDESEKQNYIDNFLREDIRKGFILSKDVLIRISILQTSKYTYKLIMSFHHIIIDGWSLSIITQELLHIYQSLINNKEPRLEAAPSYSTYINWLNSQDNETALSYWKEYLKGYEQVAGIPETKERPEKNDYILKTRCFEIDESNTSKIDKVSRNLSVTMYTFLETVWGSLVQYYNNVDDVVLGSVVSGRPTEIAGIGQMVGLFINTVPVRIKAGSSDTFTELVSRVNNDSIQAMKYHHLQLARIQSNSALKSGLLKMIIVFENYPIESRNKSDDNNQVLQISDVEVFGQTNYNFYVVIIPGNKITIKLNYNCNVYDDAFVEQVECHFKQILNQVIDNPGVKLSEMEVLSEEEKYEILFKANDAKAEYTREKTIHALFEEVAEKWPDKDAVIYDGKALTYRELNERANSIARLLREKGAKQNTVIGIMVERSLHTVTGILGILKAGAAYLPLDCGLPKERAAFILSDSGANILLTHQNLAHDLQCKVERIDIGNEEIYQGHVPNPEEINKPTDLAYIIYTSGTTGNPKGVMIEHINVVRLLFNDKFQFSFGPSDIWTLFHSFSFDFSVWEIFGSLLYGGKLVIVPKDITKDPQEFLKLLKKEKVTVLNQVPTAFAQLAQKEMDCVGSDLNIRYVIFGGEALKPEILREWKEKYPKAKLVNMYGITETTVHVTYKEITQTGINENVSNIGTPIPTTTTYILDRNMKLLPIGVVGELYVGGDGVARGYLNRPELMAERFVQNPYKSGERLYKSGDLARRLPNGDMEYAGRIDHQVKIRGYRIELGEIENRLLTYKEITEAAVIDTADINGNRHLCAYIVTDGDLEIDMLRKYLMNNLPDYMVPAYFVILDSLPVTDNGKLDRKYLPNPELGGAAEEYSEPKNELEDTLLHIWEEVLQTDVLGVHSNFFGNGGDSIKAITLVSRVNKALGTSTKVKDLYLNPTVRELAMSISTNAGNSVLKELDKGLVIIEDLKREVVASSSSLLSEDYEDFYPLSQIQQGMVFYSMLKPEEPLYHDQFTYTIRFDKFDERVLYKTVNILMQENPILRTTFRVNNLGQSIQIVHKELSIKDMVEDISYLQKKEQEEFIRAYMQRDLKDKFRFDKDLLWRIKIFRLNSGICCIVLSFQHAVLDGWSVATFSSKFAKIYSFLITGKEYRVRNLKSSYKDYVAICLSRRTSEGTVQFWKRTLEGYTRNKLPFNFSGKRIDNVNTSKVYRQSIDSELVDKLEHVAKELKCTLKDICLCAYIYLMAVITTDDDIVTGLVTHDRPAIEDSEKVLGCFLNTIPVRVKINRKINKFTLLNEVKKYLNEAKAHEVFLADIAHMIGEANNMDNPIFDTLFNYTDFRSLDSSAKVWGSMEKADYGLYLESSEMTNTLFDFEISRNNSGLGVQIKYSPNYFLHEDILHTYIMYKRLLENFVNPDECELKREYLISREERERILYDFNSTKIDYPKHKTIHGLFEEQVERTPDNVALVFDKKTLTYSQLNEKSNKLARFLVEKGINSGQHVGLIVQRSFDMIVAMLAVLKCGAIYVPIDPEYPKGRKEYIAGNARVTALLVDNDYGITFENVFRLDMENLQRFDVQNLCVNVEPTNPAYVIYTSGSTGLPKGVVIEHYSAVNLITWVNKTFNVNVDDVLLFVTPMCFDLSVYDIFGTLASGGRLVIAKKEQVQNPEELKSLITENGVTFWDSVPTTMNYLINSLIENGGSYSQYKLRLVFLSGDWIPVKLPERIKNFFPQAQVISLGGATECTVWSNYYPVNEVTEYQNSIPYGKPIDNNYFYILDKYMEPVPQGVAGELYIGGVGVAREYINDEIRTSHSFLPNKFLNPQKDRIYKTGDYGRYLPDGNIQLLGRIDYQVKIRGFRVELEEIESRLSKHGCVKEAVVIDRTDSGGNKYICAYIVYKDEISVSDLRNYLMKDMPEYMIPSYFVRLDKLPLTVNGKIDKKGLPEPEMDVLFRSEYTAPGNSTEEKLVQIWKHVLGINLVGIDDNFFELGGHSLKATQLVSHIHRELNVEVPLREIFNRQTVRELAAFIHTVRPLIYSSIKPTAKKEYYPVSAAQKRIYILSQRVENNTTFNTPMAVKLIGRLDVARLEQVFKDMIQRHESLRTSFEIVHGEIVQWVHEYVDFAIECITSGERKQEEIVQAFVKPFDLRKAPLIKVGLVKIDENNHIFMLDIHHIVSDGISMGILLKEMVQLYEGETPVELKIQYKDFCEWQNTVLSEGNIKEQEDYWLGLFKNEVAPVDLPTDFSRPLVRSFEGSRINFSLGESRTLLLYKLARQTGTTIFMLLLASYHILLARWCAKKDVVVGSPVAGRPYADLETVVGVFANTLAMRNSLEGCETFIEFLGEVKENTFKAFDNQDYPFDVLVNRLNLQSDISRNPLFDASFILQNTGLADINGFKDLKVEPFDYVSKTAKQDLLLEAIEANKDIFFSFEYCTRLFKKETVEKLAESFVSILSEITINPNIRLSDIHTLSEGKKMSLIEAFNED